VEGEKKPICSHIKRKSITLISFIILKLHLTAILLFILVFNDVCLVSGWDQWRPEEVKAGRGYLENGRKYEIFQKSEKILHEFSPEIGEKFCRAFS
jgi:hypothetical protein